MTTDIMALSIHDIKNNKILIKIKEEFFKNNYDPTSEGKVERWKQMMLEKKEAKAKRRTTLSTYTKK